MIALGCDHGGYALMKEVIAYLDANKIATFATNSGKYKNKSLMLFKPFLKCVDVK